jgi:hypothetical protein
MSKVWTKQEEAVLTEYMGARRVLYWRDKCAIHNNLLPKRSPAAIEKRWGIMLKRTKKQYAMPLEPKKPFDKLQDEIEKLRAKGIFGLTPPPQYNPVDVAFTRPITKTDIIRHYRDMGLRGRIAAVYELGD